MLVLVLRVWWIHFWVNEPGIDNTHEYEVFFLLVGVIPPPIQSHYLPAQMIQFYN